MRPDQRDRTGGRLMSFAERLKELREGKGLSQNGLSKLAGLTRQTVSRLEMSGRDANWETVQRLCLALGVDCRVFLDAGLTVPSGLAEDPPPTPATEPKVNEEAPPTTQEPGPEPAPKKPRKKPPKNRPTTK